MTHTQDKRSTGHQTSHNMHNTRGTPKRGTQTARSVTTAEMNVNQKHVLRHQHVLAPCHAKRSDELNPALLPRNEELPLGQRGSPRARPLHAVFQRAAQPQRHPSVLLQPTRWASTVLAPPAGIWAPAPWTRSNRPLLSLPGPPLRTEVT